MPKVGEGWTSQTDLFNRLKKYFPNISPEAYWTSKRTFLNRKMVWTVNFMTGHNYSRFHAYQQLPVLFVKDR